MILETWDKTSPAIDLSVSPSPRTQTSQWHSSISCTGSGTQTYLGFSAIEKHWSIQSSHRFMLQKCKKRCAWGTCNILRGSAISFILLHFLNPNKTEQNVFKYSTPIQIKNFLNFRVVILSYNFRLLKQNINVILSFSKVSLAKTS